MAKRPKAPVAAEATAVYSALARAKGASVKTSLPNAVYSARGRARRIEQGGEPIGGTLKPEAGQALRAMMELGVYDTKLAAIEASVIHEYERVRRRKARG